ncbi:MAG TPA: transketolase [Anaerolineales bacterium]|nr:transketolase [Anaerolineales bacterium]
MAQDLTRQQLDQLAKEFRYILADQICQMGWGHLGGTFSLVEIVITLYWRIMQIDPKNPKWEDRDRLVLSKGHAGPVVYAALAYKGFFPIRELATVNLEGSRLPSHANALLTPGVDMTTGSMGQGLSCACGLALSARMDGKKHTVFCIVGDGESDEGQIWEAAMFAGHNKLENLVAICDYNRFSIDGPTDEICTLEPLADKWRAFNWEVFEMDGHDWDEVYSTIVRSRHVQGMPTMIIAHTKKAKGHRDYENLASSHCLRLTDDAAKKRLLEGIEGLDFEWSKQ